MPCPTPHTHTLIAPGRGAEETEAFAVHVVRAGWRKGIGPGEARLEAFLEDVHWLHSVEEHSTLDLVPGMWGLPGPGPRSLEGAQAGAEDIR